MIMNAMTNEQLRKERLDSNLRKLSVRAQNCLMSAEVYTLKQLLQIERTELLKFRNVGKNIYNEICDFLDDVFTFKIDNSTTRINFNGISDAELVNELRSRGYEVMAKKMIEL